MDHDAHALLHHTPHTHHEAEDIDQDLGHLGDRGGVEVGVLEEVVDDTEAVSGAASPLDCRVVRGVASPLDCGVGRGAASPLDSGLVYSL